MWTLVVLCSAIAWHATQGALYYTVTQAPSCRHRCGSNTGSCSCSSSCERYGNCCRDYYNYCQNPTTVPPTSPSWPSCRYYCGYNMGICSCANHCQSYRNCCPDYYTHCPAVTTGPVYPTSISLPSCRGRCGSNLGNCSCDSYCPFSGDCCPDFYRYCPTLPPTKGPTTPTHHPYSCRHYCGIRHPTCSCASDCIYNGNCCRDYHSYCSHITTAPLPSCRYNCGVDFSRCSCSSSCRYNNNCCPDFYSQCYYTTTGPTTAAPCGGVLYGSGVITSPNHPDHYQDRLNCMWQLRASQDETIFLSFSYLQLENCCNCDYISVYDGRPGNMRYLGKVCNGTLTSFRSTSNDMTVVFRTDGSVVGRGFKADFTSSLPASSGRVECTAESMNIVIRRSYLDSIGYGGHSLYLNDENCRPHVTSYEVSFRYPVNSCGTMQKFEHGRVVFTNAVRAYANSYGEITRQSFLKLNVGCRMDPDVTASIMYIARHHDNSSILGTGRFNTTMNFYTSSNFYYMVTEVPYRVTLNQYLYIEVRLWRFYGDVVLFLDTCVASPNANDFYSRKYYIVQNGCGRDSTYYAYTSGSRDRVRFRFRAFQFLRTSDSVYLQCKVLICPRDDYQSRCRKGCQARAARDLGTQHDSQMLVLGPIQLKEPAEGEASVKEEAKVEAKDEVKKDEVVVEDKTE